MKFWPEIHWSEGQFLRPHHLQSAFRHADTVLNAAAGAIQPFSWGFLSLDIAEDALENGLFEIRSCEVRLRDGTHVRFGEQESNCSFSPREFKALLDKSSGPLDVYFGVPEVQAVKANVQVLGEELEGRQPRYVIDKVARNDENTGDNPQLVEVRRYRAAVFFGEEDRTGYTCVRLGQIGRAAAGPELLKNTVPPLISVRAWGPLLVAVERFWNDGLRSRMEQLGGDAAHRGLTFATGSPGDVEQLIKLHALNELTARFGVIANNPAAHPFTLYVALCEAIGKLALWDDDRRPKALPDYDHDHSGPIFEKLFRYARDLVTKMLPKDYEMRPFERQDVGFGVSLDHEWLNANRELFLGIRGPMQLEEIQSLFNQINFKLASPQDAKKVYEGGLRGLQFTHAGTVPNLPKSADQFYFRIARTSPYWEHCEQERGIFIRMPPSDMDKLSSLELALFVIKVGK